MTRYDDLPYRTCVGMMLINPAGLVFIGRRAGGIEQVDESHVWQMPQGGVDHGEDTWEAAKRELYEETSVRSIEKLGRSPASEHSSSGLALKRPLRIAARPALANVARSRLPPARAHPAVGRHPKSAPIHPGRGPAWSCR